MSWHAATLDTVTALKSTLGSFLVNKTPLTSSNCLPENLPVVVSPTHRYHHQLLLEDPQSETEKAYQPALKDSYAHLKAYKSALIGIQATTVLQNMFIGHLSNQLQAQEDKQKQQKKGKLNADGLPKLLTRETFQTLVNKQVAAMEREKVEREIQQKQKEAQSELMATWKEAEEARKQRKKERQEAYQEELRLWEEEHDLAKLAKRRVHWANPKRGKLERALPRPGAKSNEKNEAHSEWGENEHDSDEGMLSDGGSADE